MRGSHKKVARAVFVEVILADDTTWYFVKNYRASLYTISQIFTRRYRFAKSIDVSGLGYWLHIEQRIPPPYYRP